MGNSNPLAQQQNKNGQYDSQVAPKPAQQLSMNDFGQNYGQQQSQWAQQQGQYNRDFAESQRRFGQAQQNYGQSQQNYGQQQSQWAQQQGQGNQYGRDQLRQQEALAYAQQQAGNGPRYAATVQQPGTEAPQTRPDPSQVTRNLDYGNIPVDPNLQSQQYNPMMAQAPGQQYGTGRYNQNYGQQQQGWGQQFGQQSYGQFQQPQYNPYGGGNPFMQQYSPPQQFNFPQYGGFGGGNPFAQQMNPYQMQQYTPQPNYRWR